MKYRDLILFEAVTEVIQLISANKTERLPEQALQEDPKLKLYYDNALNRAPAEIKQERLI
ncbi:MAG: hypothetical protein GYA45_02120 [Pelolinea sp.]|jgi:hypothetical protein|nr:hypothetical protein [Pelolinea sp.]